MSDSSRKGLAGVISKYEGESTDSDWFLLLLRLRCFNAASRCGFPHVSRAVIAAHGSEAVHSWTTQCLNEVCFAFTGSTGATALSTSHVDLVGIHMH